MTVGSCLPMHIGHGPVLPRLVRLTSPGHNQFNTFGHHRYGYVQTMTRSPV